MTSRTPIRLTPHRGPLATPSTSPESSPTLLMPSTDIPLCSASIRQALDVAIMQHKISTLSPPPRHQCQSRLFRRRCEVAEREPSGRGTHADPLSFILESLFYSACDLWKSLGGIVTFCLLIWGLLEWSSHTTGLHRQPNFPVPALRFPPPSTMRTLRCHENPSLCEPRDQHVAILHFLSEQIQHARALSSLSISLGLPLRTFFEAHRTTIPRVIIRHNLTAPSHPVQDADTLANLTKLLDSSLLDFSSGSFVGRTLTLALDELGDLISEPVALHDSSTHGGHQDAHLHAIYWRTTSNLLLEYSAARPRVRSLLQQLRTLHQRLSPLALGHYATKSVEERWNIWLRKNGLGHPATSIEDGMQSFMAGLEITLGNAHRLAAYLDWITEQLAQATLRDVLEIRHKPDFSSCMLSLQELFAQSRPSISQKRCFCFSGYGATPIRPERVEIMVPGSATVRAGR